MAGENERLAIGIDLGTKNSCVGMLQHEGVEFIANDRGKRTTPSYVAFTKKESIVGDAAMDEVAMNPTNTVFGQSLPSRAVHAYHRQDHQLQLENLKKPFECNGCKMKGFGLTYRCDICNFCLHTHCMFPEPIATHDFFGTSEFKFLQEIPGKCPIRDCRDCDIHCQACARPTQGYVYRCEEKHLNLHPCCFNLAASLRIDDDIEFKLSTKRLSEKCLWCDKKRLKGSVTGNSGWSYGSTCKKYHCHAFCSTKMLLQGWESSDNNQSVPNNLKLSIEAHLERNKRRGKKFLTIAKDIFKILVSIIIGDPTSLLASIILESIDLLFAS